MARSRRDIVLSLRTDTSYDRMRGRVVELEAALRRIANHPNWYTDNGDTRACDAACVEHIMAVAKQALGER